MIRERHIDALMSARETGSDCLSNISLPYGVNYIIIMHETCYWHKRVHDLILASIEYRIPSIIGYATETKKLDSNIR
jgi:hypothetical protein